MTTVEHLDRCEACRRRTLHRRTVERDRDGVVVSDVRTCVACANREAGTSQVLVMKEARSLKRMLRDQPSKRRGKPTRSG